MNNIEIEKLKTEHARYEKALKFIQHEYVPSCVAHTTADAALNPPPVPPVSVAEILTALRDKNRRDSGALHSIRFFSDESGFLYSEIPNFFASFYSLREALDMLKRP